MSGDKKEKQKFKVSFDAITSWAATIVILGALWKILHLKGSSIMITAGLGTEALLFFLAGFRPAHKEPDWTRVYPQLAEDYDITQGPINTSSVSHSVESSPSVVVPSVNVGGAMLANLEPVMYDSNVTPEMIQRMGEGLKNFGDKISNISNVADTALATTEFNDNVKIASETFKTLNQNFQLASEKLNEVAISSLDSLAYKEQVQNLTKNLTALNAIYENYKSQILT